MTKHLSRRKFLAKRQAFYSQEYRDCLDSRLLANFITLLAQLDIENICLYHAKDDEISCQKIHEYLQKIGKNIYYPKIIATKMLFIKFESFVDFRQNQYGIMEPTSGNQLSGTALIITPAIAIHQDGHRLGYGKGYYDKFIIENRHHIYTGLTLENLLLEKDLSEPHDQKLDFIITENRIIEI